MLSKLQYLFLGIILTLTALHSCKNRTSSTSQTLSDTTTSSGDPLADMFADPNYYINVSSESNNIVTQNDGSNSTAMALADPTSEGFTIEGDMLIPNDSLNLGSNSTEIPLWEKGIVPYTIENAAKEYTSNIKAGMDLISSVSNIQFVDSTSTDYTYILNNKIISHTVTAVISKAANQNSDVCSGVLGFHKKSRVILTGGCTPGSIAHELLHVLGFHHEHTSPNRDDNVAIISENFTSFIDDKGQKQDPMSNYGKITNQNQKLNSIPYDYGSIMHYGSFYFSKNRISLPTMVKMQFASNWKTANRGDYEIIPNRQMLSDGDIAALKALYPDKINISANSSGNGNGQPTPPLPTNPPPTPPPSSGSGCTCGPDGAGKCMLWVGGVWKMSMNVPDYDPSCQTSCTTGALANDPRYPNCTFKGSNSNQNRPPQPGTSNPPTPPTPTPPPSGGNLGCVCGIDASLDYCAVYKKLPGNQYKPLAWSAVAHADRATCTQRCNPQTGILADYLRSSDCQ